MLLTNNPLLVSIAKRNYDRFKVSTSLIESTKSKRYYTPEQQADLDIKTSVNKIGEIVNLSQELQTLMWHKMNNGASFDEVKEIYYDACQLNAMTGAEIDMAKKEFDINNEAELQLLREKYRRKDYLDRYIKPYFFGHVDKTKGYYNEERKSYMKHDTSMDYLREIIEDYRSPRYDKSAIKLSSILIDAQDHKKENRRQVDQIIYQIEQFKKTSYYIWGGYAENTERYQMYLEAENGLIDSINNRAINIHTLYRIIQKLDNSDMSDFVFKILFNIGNNMAFELVKESREPIALLEEDPEGDISLYGIRFKKSQKDR